MFSYFYTIVRTLVLLNSKTAGPPIHACTVRLFAYFCFTYLDHDTTVSERLFLCLLNTLRLSYRFYLTMLDYVSIKLKSSSCHVFSF